MNRLIAIAALGAAAVIALPFAFAATVPADQDCSEADPSCECEPGDVDADGNVCQAPACVCPAAKDVNISADVTLPRGHAAIPEPFNNPASATGTSRASANGNIVCHITAAPDASGNVASCTRSYNAATGMWTTSGNCTAPGTATNGNPTWCSVGKASLPAGVRADLDREIGNELARACDCAVVNSNSACAGNCAPNGANPPTRNPVAGRDETELSFSRQANGSVVVSIIENWTIHCIGNCA